MAAPVFIDTPPRFGFLGDEASEMAETVRVASALAARKTVGVAGLVGGGLLLAVGLFSKGPAQWPARLLGTAGVGGGLWMLLKGKDYEGFFPWETKPK